MREKGSLGIQIAGGKGSRHQYHVSGGNDDILFLLPFAKTGSCEGHGLVKDKGSLWIQIAGGKGSRKETVSGVSW